MIYITLGKRMAKAVAPALFLFAAAISGAQASDFQQYRVGTCTNHKCVVNFSTVPAGKVLRASRASCYLKIANVTSPIYLNGVQMLLLNSAGNTLMSEAMPMQLLMHNVQNTAITDIYEDNETIQITANAGQRLQAFADATSGDVQLFACHTSGVMTP